MTQPPPPPPDHPEPSSRPHPEPPPPAHPETPPQYPETPPQHPQATPPYPQATASAPPQSPGPAPQYPGSAPQYPQATASPPPQYPTAAPQYPTASPQYPQATPSHPQATASAPPQPPGPAPQYPTAAPPTAPAPPMPPVPPPPAEHPHHIDTDRGRVFVSAKQRQTDATAVGNLLLHVPNFLCSLFVVALVSLFFGGFGIVVILAWLASGALVFHRPTESALARHVLRLRYPTPQERAKLEPVWREVTARAGIEGRNYELWVEDSDALNAVAAAGHIVGVTRFAMHGLPNGELAAVMAHELGHHVGGHAWSSLLGYWYALPGRVAWRVLKACSGFMFKVSRAFGCFGIGFLVLVVGSVGLATISSLYGLPLLILAVPYALAAVGRRSELRADEHAAALGFAPMLAAVLDKMHQQEQWQQAQLAARNGGRPVEESTPARLLASHPDYYTRLHHLQPYLQSPQTP
ncbi:M48 family metalloprotease [Streptomyces camelliae]|uniref:M48 family metalloprotease n=1 Tax=Streptomyces camelliae TaxID=3004093 RepID=A0ABY7P4H9_9ACTN|nr:M48 family metalloprotease [Streptomyces sp. HUAS 2-6]WBO64444.1 M48 family metalloprotease [Streptomyces sp. HUAS 2-6]